MKALNLVALVVIVLAVPSGPVEVAEPVSAGPLCAGEDPGDTVQCNVNYAQRCVHGIRSDGPCP